MKKIITVILAVIMALMMTTTIFAAVVTPEFSATKINAEDDITVTLKLDEKMTGITNFEYRLYFNPELFVLKSSSKGEANSATTITAKAKTDANGTYYGISFLDSTSSGQVINEGVLYTLVFTALEDITEDTEAEFNLTRKFMVGQNDTDIDEGNVNGGNVSIDISPKPVLADGVIVEPTTKTISVGGSFELKATVTPEGADNKNVTYAVTGDAVSVNTNGVVTGVKVGTATVKVTTHNGKTATCVVTVVACFHENKTEVPAEAATCSAKGNEKYYTCDDCDVMFAADGITVITAVPETDKDASNHAGTETYVDKNDTTATHHKVKYSCCGALKETVAHTGGTANCKELAKCEACERAYGSVDSTKHKAATTWTTENGEHYHVCENGCGSKLDKATCSGGIATCVAKAKCDVCDKEYGSVDSTNHKAATTWTAENGEHYHVCENGCGSKLDKATCSGGTATCVAKAKCDVCDSDYGEIDFTNHDYTGVTPTYTWTETASACTATRVCTRDASHVESVTENSTGSYIKEPNCKEDGRGKYVVSFSNTSWATEQTTERDIKKLDHDWGAWYYVEKPTTEKTGLQRRDCEFPGCDEYEEKIVPKLSEEKTEVIVDMTKPSTEKTEEEENPNTGAPVFGMLPVAIVAAAVVAKRKK